MMEPHSILAGKTYRAADDELRRVVSIEGDIVVYKSVVATPGVIGQHADMKMPLGDFAQQAQGELPG